MTHTLKRTFAMLLLAVFGSAILYNCEPDPDSLGQQLFDKDAAVGNENLYSVIAYNINNNDSIKSDATRLFATGGSAVAVLGAFKDDQFGMQKASYATQLRMPSSFDFGDKPVVDSVVLVVRTPANTADDTYYFTDKVIAPGAYEKSDFPVGNDKVAVSIEKKSYPVRKYGKTDGDFKSLKINVHEVTDFIDASKKEFIYSNGKVNINTDKLLGSAIFDGYVSTVTVTKKSDNTNVFDGKLGFRINLDKTFFQTNILDLKGDPKLQDAANFTRHFKGIQLSVENTDGYLFQFAPNDMEVIMYYKSDRTANGVVTRSQSVLNFNLGGLNAHIGKYEYARGGSPADVAVKNADTKNGDASLFVQGMGGASIGLKIEKSTIEDLKKAFNDKKAGIVGAKIRVFVDKNKTFNNAESVTADRKFTLLPDVDAKGKPVFTSDLLKGFPMYTYGKATIENVEYEYYDFVVTQTLKDIVEKPEVLAADKMLYLNLGAFVKSTNGGVYGPNYTTRATDMNRVVLFGVKSTPIDPKKPDERVQLRVTYSTAKQ